MLDIALVNFVGAGLTSFAPAYGLDCPKGAITNGKILIQNLFQHDRINTQDVVERTVKSIWQDWLNSGMPTSVAVAHLEHLPAILEANQPDTDVLIGAVAVASTSTKLGRGTIDAQARRLSTDIVERAKANASLERAGLSEAVTFYFFEAIYLHLLASKKFIDSMQSQLRSYIDKQPWQFPAASAPSAVAEQSEAEQEQPLSEADSHTEISSADAAPATDDTDNAEEPAGPLSTMDDSDHGPAGSADDGDETSAAMAIANATMAKRGDLVRNRAGADAYAREICTKLLADLAAPVGANDDYATALHQARIYVVGGQIVEAETALSDAENAAQSAAQSAPEDSANLSMAAATARSMCGQLQEMLFEFQRAAGHYAAAVRHIPRDDYRTRWIFAEQQARALVRQDEIFGDRDALEEATKICSGIIAILHDDQTGEYQAHAKALLGEILVLLGRKDRQPAQFKLAIRHLGDAIALYDDQQTHERTSNSKLALADALYGLGTVEHDHVILEDSVRQYQDILALSSDQRPSMTSNDRVSIKLGTALTRLGVITQSDDVLAVAIETLRSALDDLQAPTSEADTIVQQGHANAALAQALAARAEFAESREELEATLPIYALAIATLAETGDPAEIEQLRAEQNKIRQTLGLEDPAERNQPTTDLDTSDADVTASDTDTEGGYLSRLRATLKLSTPQDAGTPPATKRHSA